MTVINFEAKTDRELLLLTAQRVNDIGEIELPLIRTEIINIQKQVGDYRQKVDCIGRKVATPNYFNLKIWGLIGGTGIIIGSAVYELGRRIGWWQ